MKKIFFSLMFILIATLGFSQNSKIDKDYSSLILGNWKLREAASDGVNKGFAMYGDDYYGESFYRDNGTSTHISLYKTSWKIDKNILIETLLEDNGQSGTGEIWTKYEILILDEETLTLKVIERHGNTSYNIDNAPQLIFKRK